MISCKKGCCFCCSASAYVEATLQECEAIVYHLYQNNHVLESFMQKYPQWRDQIKKNDLLDSCGRFWEESAPETAQEFTMFMNKKEEKRYRQQNIPCPFLDNQLCSIYEVRPYTCISCIAVSPPEWCNPQSQSEPEIRKVYPIDFLRNMITDYSFYYKNVERFVITFMPIVVYEILRNGTFYYSYGKIPSLQQLHHDFIYDPEVVTILNRHGLSPNEYNTLLNHYSGTY
jgi:Fe-S-cluster containining protein